ncbi:MAG: nucleotidyl transferase AbiEii/AbiGii toxin family protein [Bacteroidota bacterium]
MIPNTYILEWGNDYPWQTPDQIEQDLLISRTLIHIFSDDFLRERLAFRGGTALHKLYLKPAPRYSEDIDLVQIKPAPIGPIMQRLREVIDFFEEPRRTKVGGHGAKAFYRFTSEFSGERLRLKIEINGKEHFNVFPWVDFPFKIANGWFNGTAQIRTYDLHELLGTKLRALYQRSKGRDLFDLDYARRRQTLDAEKIVRCFQEYIRFSTGKRPPSRKEFLLNLEAKSLDSDFMGDMEAILRPGISYEPEETMSWVKENLVALLP